MEDYPCLKGDKLGELIANPVGKPIFDECVESTQVWELSPVKL